MSMLGARPSRMLIICWGFLATAALIAFAVKFGAPCVSMPGRQLFQSRRNLLIVPLLALLTLSCIYCAVSSLGFQLINWDAIVIWGFKAKVLFTAALYPRPWYFHDARLSYSHLDYPLLSPMMQAAAYSMVGAVDERLGKSVVPVLFAGQTLMMYAGCRRFLSQLPALGMTVLACCTPFAIEVSGMGNADVPLATFQAGALVYLISWMLHKHRSDLLLAATFLVLGVNTKNEGLPFGITAAILVVIFASLMKLQPRQWFQVALFLGVFLVGSSVWLIWRQGVLHTDENYPSQLAWKVVSQNLSRVPIILRGFAGAMIDLKSWNAIWLLLPFSAAIAPRAFASRPIQFLWLMLAAQLSIYFVAYLITPWEVEQLMRNSVYRLLLHIMPTASLIVTGHLGTILQSQHAIKEAA